MSTPGFTAEHSLYRTCRNYCTFGTHPQANGMTLQLLPSQIPPPIHPCGLLVPCYVSGTTVFCCPPGQSCCDPDTNTCCLPGQCCNGECCSPGHACCNGECCGLPGWSCCNGECCPPGQCCNGICCPNGVCCNGVCCSGNQACFNGCCASYTVGLTPNGNNNYIFMSSANGNICQNILGLKVSLNVTQDMVATVTGGGTTTQNGGFSMQLNAYPGVSSPTTDWMQYVFIISGNAINSQVQYWDLTAWQSCLTNCDQKCLNRGQNVNQCQANCPGQCVNSTNVPVNSSQRILDLFSNTIPAGYVLEIDLNNDATGNITGATFTVTDNNGNTTSRSTTLPANQQFPIVGFQVDLVGPDNSQNSQFSSGAGTITYEISDGQLCPAADQCGPAGT
jgi:hypothetical protein